MFEDSHESFARLLRVFAGQVSPIEADRIATHLMSCRACWLLAIRAISAQKVSGAIAVQGPLKSLVDFYEIEQERLEQWLEARATWIEIRPLTLKTRRDKVRLTRALHTLSFLEILLEEGTSASPAESEEYFYLALLVAGQLAEPEISKELKNDLCAECCAEIANARRRLAKWTAARDALKKGSDYAEKGSQNGVAEAKVLCVAGALEDDLGNTEEATRILRRSAEIFEASGQTFLLSRTLTQLAFILVDLDPAESLQLVEKALSTIPGNNPRLIMFAEGIKIDCLLALGAVQRGFVEVQCTEGAT